LTVKTKPILQKFKRFFNVFPDFQKFKPTAAVSPPPLLTVVFRCRSNLPSKKAIEKKKKEDEYRRRKEEEERRRMTMVNTLLVYPNNNKGMVLLVPDFFSARLTCTSRRTLSSLRQRTRRRPMVRFLLAVVLHLELCAACRHHYPPIDSPSRLMTINCSVTSRRLCTAR
jgi:hypothetical protein